MMNHCSQPATAESTLTAAASVDQSEMSVLFVSMFVMAAMSGVWYVGKVDKDNTLHHQLHTTLNGWIYVTRLKIHRYTFLIFDVQHSP